ncbi:uncharacterized protein LOC112460984 [Temnothorax curvispinosus]|uniref:Uncharacterized protein LOC112460984 n=1 Tax=Temnothorax curvispinosus TaxID=300111 RepID=A0A6J1QH94_9HYME|nr:uncharacterized protein LOC112460984 [Temnothorax curvispinosus]
MYYRTVMVLRKKRSKLWNYFEELKPTLRHGIFLDNDTLTFPDDLKQYYSELPGYKAKCNNCGKTLSFLGSSTNLRGHLRRHSIRIQSRDKTVMVLRKKRSKLWNYFEELKPTLVKCRTCKKEIKISRPSNSTAIFRAHLKRHGIFLDNDILTFSDDLKQYYSELPGYKVKCNNCGKTLSFLGNTTYLREHLTRHSIRIQSRNETTPTKKRSKWWNYFEDLKPSLVKCTTCKKEIKISYPSSRTTIFRAHLKRHGIFLDNDTYTLLDELKQCYSELPGYEAKCNNYGETIGFLKSVGNLRQHLKIHSTRIHSRDEPSTSSLADDSMGPPARRQGQDTSGLLVQSFIKETTEKTGALNELSTSSSPGNDIDPNAKRQGQETIDLALQSCEQSRKETRTRDGPSTLNSMAYITDLSTEKYIPLRQSQEQVPSGLPVQSFEQMPEGTSALHSDRFYCTM